MLMCSSALYSVAASRTLECEAQRRLGITAAMLMERAGEAAWAIARQRWPNAQKILVVCGSGNNGGDGYFFARCAQRAGCDVRVIQAMGESKTVPAQAACAAYAVTGEWLEPSAVCWHAQDLIVDALLGIGLNRPVDRSLARLIDAINASGRPVLALDTPSGVDAETGHVAGVAVNAAVTIQFLLPHVGLYTGSGCDAAGICLCDSLQLPNEMQNLVTPLCDVWSSAQLAEQALSARRRASHKGDYGQVVCLGGDHGSGGAIILTALAALRVGAGLVRMASRSAHVAAALARAPELMPCGVDHHHEAVQACARASVVAIGPGLGRDAWGQALWRAALDAQRPLVIDADALNLLAAEPHPVPAAILTPHPGEAARLLGSSAAAIQANRFAAAQSLAQQFAAVVVLKGAGTIVVAPGQRARLLCAGNPGMAVGGMGDVLTGIIAGLLAQGLTPFEAASRGALIHACGGDAVAAEQGECGMSPADVIAMARRLVNRARISCATGA